MTAETLQLVTADRPGERLDVAVARLCDMSRAQAQRLIDEGLVSDVRRVRTKAGDKLEGGERLTVQIPPVVSAIPLPEDVALNILFEDEHMLVVDKPAGMPVHPGPGHADKTLVNALLAHCPNLPGIGGVQRPGIVHRLDKDTSGLILVAKDEAGHKGLSAQLKDREMSKTYLTLVEGRLTPPEAMIDAPIGRDPNNRRRMMVLSWTGSAHSREAQTSYKLRTQYDTCALVEVSLHTGRTHQIRVHFASIGFPVVGDAVYGRRSSATGEIVYGHRSALVDRQFLHAWRIQFRHPVDGRELSFEAPLPADLQAALDKLS